MGPRVSSHGNRAQARLGVSMCSMAPAEGSGNIAQYVPR